MNSRQEKTLRAIFSKPVPASMEWRKIEGLLKGLGCEVIEGSGSRIAVIHPTQKLTLHRPHPGKEALRYQIVAIREFLESIGAKP